MVLLATPSGDACAALRSCVGEADVACAVGEDLAAAVPAWFVYAPQVDLASDPADLLAVVAECVGRREVERRTPARTAVLWIGEWPYLAGVVELRRCQRGRTLDSRRRCSGAVTSPAW